MPNLLKKTAQRYGDYFGIIVMDLISVERVGIVVRQVRDFS